MEYKTIYVAGYYRVSTKAESQKSSFENQPAYFKTILDRRNRMSKVTGVRYEMVESYHDYGETGTSFNREGFKRMLEEAGLEVEVIEKAEYFNPKYPEKPMKQRKYVTSVDPKKEPKFKEIWIKSTSRFARNINGFEILQTLKRKGVYVYFIDIDKSTERDENMEAIRQKLDGDMSYSEQLSRNMRIVQEQYQRENRVRGKMYGYDYHPKTKSELPYYTINEEQANIVKKIFECICEMGTKATINKLASEGFFDERGKPFAKTRLRNIIKNEKYKGLNYVGKYTTGDLFDKFETPQLNPNYALQESEALPPIVSAELWQKANEAIAARNVEVDGKLQGIHAPSHKYKDLLRCGYCGNNFIFDTNRGYEGKGYYRCATKRNRGAKVCNCTNVFDYQLIAFIERLKNGELHNLIETDFEATIISLIYLIEAYLGKYSSPSYNSEASPELLEKLEKQRNSRAVVMEMLTGDFSEDTLYAFREKITSIDTEIKEIENALAEQKFSPIYCEAELEKLFQVAFEDLTIYKEKKKTYIDEEVLSLIDRIEVYGRSELNGGKPANVSLVPVLKVSEKAQGLKKYGIEKFNIGSIACGNPNYEAPDHFIQSLRKDRRKPLEPLTPADTIEWNKQKEVHYGTGTEAEELREIFKRPPKSEWLKNVAVPYNISGNCFDLEKGFIKNIGFENEPIFEQIEKHLYSLYERFTEEKAKLH